MIYFLEFLKEWWFLILGFISFIIVVFNLGKTISKTLNSIDYEMKDFNYHLNTLKKDRERTFKRMEKHNDEIKELYALVFKNEFMINNLNERTKNK